MLITIFCWASGDSCSPEVEVVTESDERNHRRSNWLRDVKVRQRKTVFPDTGANDRRLWEGLVFSKQRMNVIDVLGALLIALTLFAAIGSEIAVEWHVSSGTGSIWVRTIHAFAGRLIALGVLAAFLLTIKIVVQRSDRTGSSRK